MVGLGLSSSLLPIYTLRLSFSAYMVVPLLFLVVERGFGFGLDLARRPLLHFLLVMVVGLENVALLCILDCRLSVILPFVCKLAGLRKMERHLCRS